jgi:hypothetical protein
MEFHVLGEMPAASTPFCLALTSMGSTSGDCLAVDFGFIRNGGTAVQIVDNPNNLATLQLSPSASYWLVNLDGLSDANPPTRVLSRNSDTGGSELLEINDGTNPPSYGRNNVPGTWSMIDPTAGEVPEPATWTAMAAGLGVIGLLRRNRKTADRKSLESQSGDLSRS